MNPVNGKTMHDLYQSTVEKAEYVKGQGYQLIEIWECQINRELKQNEEMKRHFEQHEAVDPFETPRRILRWTHQCSQTLSSV